MRRKSVFLMLTLCVGVTLLYYISNSVLSKSLEHIPHKQIFMSKMIEIFQDRIGYKPKLELIKCLHVHPALERYEIIPNSELTDQGNYVCANSNKTFNFDLNFNIERSYKFIMMENSSLMSDKKVVEDINQPSQYTEGIPKIFHFIWNDAVIPTNFIKNLKRYYELHPGWTFHFWSLKHGRDVIKKLEPHILPAFDGYVNTVSRADALRYVLLYHIGGAYFDLDTYPYIPLDNLTTLSDCICGAEPIENALFILGLKSLLTTGALLCKPKHAFFRYAIDALPEASKLKDKMLVAGPMFLTKVVNSYILEQTKNWTVLDKNIPTDMFVVRHEYFEFAYHRISRVHCDHFLGKLDEYLKQCEHLKANKNVCTEKVTMGIKPKDRIPFDACLEWTRHGKNARNITLSIRYMNHEHIGTHIWKDSISINPENKISNILPKAILHL